VVYLTWSEERPKEKSGFPLIMGRKERCIMKIAVIGYIIGDNKIIVSYDAVNEEILVEEVYKDRDLGVTVGFSYSVKSREEVRESLERFKKSFNK
jgi:hypothetical protein